MQNFNRIIEQNCLVVVDFYASWCGPCRMMHPVVDALRDTFRGKVVVEKMDIDAPENREIIHKYNIMSVPTIIIFRKGEIVWRDSGVMSHDKLRATIESLEKMCVKTN